MYLDYFDKFKNQEPYLHIDEKEWTHIKDTFDKDDVKESLAKVAMTYPMPTMEMTEEDCRKDFNKLKGTWVYDILKEGECISNKRIVGQLNQVLIQVLKEHGKHLTL